MKLGKYIDSGTFSKVYLDLDRESKGIIKVIRRYSYESELEKYLLDKEIELCQKWPFSEIGGIVQVRGVEKHVDKDGGIEWWIGMDYGGMNLENFIRYGKMKKIGKKERIDMMCQLLDCIDKIEKLDYRHLDIKSKNILISWESEGNDEGGRWRIRLCDFDTLVKMTELKVIENSGVIVGTHRYLPEWNMKCLGVDRCLWSLGKVFYEIWNGSGGFIKGYLENSDDDDDDDSEGRVGGVGDMLYGMLCADSGKRFDMKDCKYALQNLGI